MLYPINEIFYSIQGEGYHTGKPAIFIRFAGCNLNCQWCDTDYSEKIKMTEHAIATKVLSFPDCPLIVLTGGEPTIHPLGYLLSILERKTDAIIAVETNGTNRQLLHHLQGVGLIDWITLSPKAGVFWDDNLIQGVKEASEIKIVFDGVITPSTFEPHILDKFKKGLCFIQPCSEDFEPAVKFVMNNPRWRLSIQTQKVINTK